MGRKIKEYKNAKFVGEVDYKDVPNLIRNFDIGIIPYKLNSFNLGTNPNKFFEYSAIGVPCISTDIPSFENSCLKSALATLQTNGLI